MPRKQRVPPPDQETKAKVAAIYCRVSTAEQGQSGLSLKDQEIRCKSLCKAKDWDIYDKYTETASAGSINRPEFQRLLNDSDNDKFDVVVALRLDRISRVPKDFYTVVELLDAHGVNITTVDNDVDTTTAQGRMLLGVLLQFAAFERELGAERTRAAMMRRAEEGLPGGSCPPLGYDRIDGKFIINKTEAKWVESIFTSYLNGEGPSKIARDLNARGRRTKKWTANTGRTTGGKRYNRNHIHRIVTNPLYAGLIYFSGENFHGAHDSIVDINIFENAQEIVRSNAERRNLGSSIRGHLLLTGIITCGFCNHAMTTLVGTGRRKGKYYYYRCAKAIREGASSCVSGPLKSEDIESLAVELIRTLANNDAYLKATMDVVTKQSQTEVDSLNRELKKEASQRRKLETKQQNLAKAIASHKDLSGIDGVIKEMEDLQERIKSYTETENDLRQEIAVHKANLVDSDALLDLYKQFDLIWDSLERTEQRNVLNLLIDHIEVTIKKGTRKGKIVVTLANGIPPKVLTNYTIGSCSCSVALRRRDSNPRPGG